jgi:hypothetical protein
MGYSGGVSQVGAKHGAHGGRRPDLGDQYFRSMWEANWARYLTFLCEHHAIRSWRYEPRTFEFVGIRRGTRFYKPDFEVIENDGQLIYDEVKGYMDQKSNTQLKRMAKYYPEVRIRVIDKKAYRSIARVMRHWIPKWETVRAS